MHTTVYHSTAEFGTYNHGPMISFWDGLYWMEWVSRTRVAYARPRAGGRGTFSTYRPLFALLSEAFALPALGGGVQRPLFALLRLPLCIELTI